MSPRPRKIGELNSNESPLCCEPVSVLRSRAHWEGVEALSDAELLTLMLSGEGQEREGPERSQTLLKEYGGLSALQYLRPHVLNDRGLLSRDQACLLAAALQLGARAQRDLLVPPPELPLTYDLVVRWARPRLAGLEHEEVWVLCVNSHTALRSTWKVGRGGIHGCGLLARDILVPVVRDGASGFILLHNHPSGDPTPSTEDIDLTRNIQLAGSTLGIPLLDHVVVARGGARSFFELGYLDG